MSEEVLYKIKGLIDEWIDEGCGPETSKYTLWDIGVLWREEHNGRMIKKG